MFEVKQKTTVRAMKFKLKKDYDWCIKTNLPAVQKFFHEIKIYKFVSFDEKIKSDVDVAEINFVSKDNGDFKIFVTDGEWIVYDTSCCLIPFVMKEEYFNEMYEKFEEKQEEPIPINWNDHIGETVYYLHEKNGKLHEARLFSCSYNEFRKDMELTLEIIGIDWICTVSSRNVFTSLESVFKYMED